MPTDYDTGLARNPANYVPITPLDFIARAAEVYGDRLAIVHGTVRQNWRDTSEAFVQMDNGTPAICATCVPYDDSAMPGTSRYVNTTFLYSSSTRTSMCRFARRGYVSRL